jgi:hypothetical protein
MVRTFLYLFTLVVAGVLALAGFRGQKFTNTPLQITPDMKHQPKVITQHGSRFFADNRGDHPIVPGTIPAGYTLPGRYLQSGVNNQNASSSFTSEPTYRDTGITTMLAKIVDRLRSLVAEKE